MSSRSEKIQTLIDSGRLAERVGKRILTATGCWVNGKIVKGTGYGQENFQTNGKQLNIMWHRACWMTSHGMIPEGVNVLHRDNLCNRRDCGNPEHLYLGSQADNMLDKAIKGSVKGELHGMSKLTEAQVLQIFKRSQSGEKHRLIAADHKITRENVGAIARGISWSWLTAKEI